jgi:hypothetical protein
MEEGEGSGLEVIIGEREKRGRQLKIKGGGGDRG